MAWVPAESVSENIPDGNDIVYPVANPSEDNKLYSEQAVSAIATALGENLKISEMAGAVKVVVEGSAITQYGGSLRTLYANADILPYTEG